MDGLSGLGNHPDFKLCAIFESRDPHLGGTQDVALLVNNHV